MNLNDTLQHWLQGEINTAVSGHHSRIDRLEQRIEALGFLLDKRDKEIAELQDLIAHFDFFAGLEECARVGSLQRLLGSEFNILHEAHNGLANKVQAMLVPETMCADDLLNKVREANDWQEALDDIYANRGFDNAVMDVVSSCDLKEMVKAIIGDLRFDVSVR